MRQTWVVNRESYVPPPPPGHLTPQSPGKANSTANFSAGSASDFHSDYLKTNTIGSVSPPPNKNYVAKMDKIDKSEWGESFHTQPKKKGHNKKGACILVIGVAIVLIGLAAASLFATGLVGGAAEKENTRAPTTLFPTLDPTRSPTPNPTPSPTPSPTRNPTPSPTNAPTTTAQPFPAQVFNNVNDMIRLTFLQGPASPIQFVEAAVTAQTRWNQIVAGTAAKVVTGNIATNVCQAAGGTFIFPQAFTINRLLIVMSFDVQDDFEICAISNFPLVAFMRFNINFFQANNIPVNTVTAIFEHRMAHMLGFGFLWPASIQGLIGGQGAALLQGAIFRADPANPGNLIFDPNAIPNFRGSAALTEFRRQVDPVDGGNPPIGINAENGRNNDGTFPFGNLVIENAANLFRKVDFHWDQDIFSGELMENDILANNIIPPISRITILSLQDMGYTVNANLANAFTLSVPGVLPGRREPVEHYSADGDVHEMRMDGILYV